MAIKVFFKGFYLKSKEIKNKTVFYSSNCGSFLIINIFNAEKQTYLFSSSQTSISLNTSFMFTQCKISTKYLLNESIDVANKYPFSIGGSLTTMYSMA